MVMHYQGIGGGFIKTFSFYCKVYTRKREAVKQLDTVTIKQMINTLLFAIKNRRKKSNLLCTKIKTFNH